MCVAVVYELFVGRQYGFMRYGVFGRDFYFWKEGQLYFKNAPFGKLVKTIERKYNVTILYDQEKYKNNKLTVKFDHDETIDEVLSILEGILQNMKYKKNNDIIFIN